MNAPIRSITTPEKAPLRVEDFFLLRQSGAFDAYDKSELIDGELWGVIRAPKRLDQWDDMVPILLRPIDHELLRQSGALAHFANTRLIDGVIWVSD